MITHKLCTMCKQSKTLSEFHRKRNGKAGRATYCKPCTTIRRRAYYERNREARIAYAQQWRKNNPEKAREAMRRRYHKSRREKIEAMRKAIKR